DGLEIELPPAHFLGGVVRDRSGAPLPWAFVSLDDPWTAEHELQGFWTLADGQGRFRFDGLPAVRMLVAAQVEGCAPLEREVTELDRDDLELCLDRSARLAGRVCSEADGSPVASFDVRVDFDLDKNERRSGRWRHFDAADGSWILDEKLEAGHACMVE